jgi:hypothetical protein
MTHAVIVEKNVYDQLLSVPSGSEIKTHIHSHGKLRGPVQVTRGGLKPIPCILQLVDQTVAARKGTKPKRIEVILTRK